jgi:hypothetical protein
MNCLDKGSKESLSLVRICYLDTRNIYARIDAARQHTITFSQIDPHFLSLQPFSPLSPILCINKESVKLCDDLTKNSLRDAFRVFFHVPSIARRKMRLYGMFLIMMVGLLASFLFGKKGTQVKTK